MYDQLDFQLNGVRSIDSDIRENVEVLPEMKNSLESTNYNLQYPSIIR